MEDPEHFSELGFKTFEQFSFPRILNVCVIRGECPCRCVHCPVGAVKPEERRARFMGSSMTIDTFRRITDETACYPHSSIRIHGVGEPVLWDGIMEAIHYARSKGVLTWLFTSLVTENRELLEEIAQNGNIIEVSMNSCDKSDYKNTKGIDAFSLVRDNLEYVRYVSRVGGIRARVIVSRVESGNESTDKEFIAFWKKSGLVDDAFVRSYHTYNDLLPGMKEKAGRGPIKCLVHWNRFNIDCDGTAVVCFNELFKESIPAAVILGNAARDAIAEIWRSERLNRIRKAFLDNDLSGLENDIPCRGCTSCQEEGGERQTSEFQLSEYRGGYGG